MEPNLGNEDHLGYKEAKANGLIECGILPLTDALYGRKCFPIASCEGHSYKHGYFNFIMDLILKKHKPSYNPFVMFTCSMGLAKELSNKLFNNPALFYAWIVRATFNPSIGVLVWTLEPSDYRLAMGDVDIDKVKQDILQLSKVVKNL